MGEKFLEKQIIKKAGETVLILEGEMDFNGARDLKAELDSLADDFQGDMVVTLDMSGISYVASDGLGFLIALHKKLATDGVKLRIVNPQQVVKELFSITGLNKVIDISSSTTESQEAAVDQILKNIDLREE